jgi:hypothetical protein
MKCLHCNTDLGDGEYTLYCDLTCQTLAREEKREHIWRDQLLYELIKRGEYVSSTEDGKGRYYLYPTGFSVELPSLPNTRGTVEDMSERATVRPKRKNG